MVGVKTLPKKKLTKCQVFLRGENPWVRFTSRMKKRGFYTSFINMVGVKTLPKKKLTKCQVFLRGENPWVRFTSRMKKRGFYTSFINMVGVKGIEPPRASSQDPKSSASTNFATRPHHHYSIFNFSLGEIASRFAKSRISSSPRIVRHTPTSSLFNFQFFFGRNYMYNLTQLR